MDKDLKEIITKEEREKVEEILEEILSRLGLEKEFELSVNEDNLEINLKTQDTGVVIGRHGEILDSLQMILSLCFSRKIGKFLPVSLEVGDYRKNRTDWLFTLAQNAKEQALTEGKEVMLSDLKPWERRVIHLHLQEDKEVITESVGEGRERTLVIKPK